MAIKDRIVNDEIIDMGDYIIDMNSNKKDIRVVFMGTPDFAVPILNGLIDNYNVVLVVSQPDRKKDRKGNYLNTPIKEVALNNGIEVYQPISLKSDYSRIIEVVPDIIITCAYGQIVPNEVLNYPKYGSINVHGSLLPELRGGAPIHWAIIRGYTKTGITIMEMNSKMDAGDIIAQESIEISDDMILDELYDKMSFLGKKLLLDTLPSIIDGSYVGIKQDESKVTFGYNVRKEDTRIDFSKSSMEIRNLIRGLNSKPGAYCYLGDKRLKIYGVDILKDTNNKNYGEIVDLDKEGIVCVTGDKLIRIVDMAYEGKKRCLAKDFINGLKDIELIGKVLR